MSNPQRSLNGALCALLFVAMSSAGPTSAQPLVIGANVNVSALAGAQSEVGIAANPTNRRNLVAVANQLGDLSRLGAWFTTDGGATWTASFIDENQDLFGAGDSRFDPNVAFDSDGNVYAVYSTTGTGNRLLLARSTNGGSTWTQVATVTTDAGANNLHTAMVTTRADPTGPDDVLVVWARVGAGGERIQAALSLDAGATFPTNNTDINDAAQRTFVPWAAPDAAGDFHVVWEVNAGGGTGSIFHDTLNATTLADGANVTVTTVQITDFAAATSRIPAQPDRGLFSVATVDVDRASGRIYLSYTDRTSTATNDTNVFVRFSDNGGATWSPATQVNADGTTTSQFFPRLAVDQTAGVVYATWYDARGDTTNNRQVDVFISSSVDGITWTANQRVTTAVSDESVNNPARNINNYGEYFGLTTSRCTAHAVWTDARAANFSVGRSEEVFVARAIRDTVPPVIANVPPPVTREQTNLAGTPIMVPIPTATDDCGAAVTITSDAPAVFPLGTTTVHFTATDEAGNSSTAQTTVTVVDTTPPTITAAVVTPAALWPPNHKFKQVVVTVSAVDVCDATLTCRISSITSNEPPDGGGDGHTAPDWRITGDLTAELRAERSGGGAGRFYTLTLACSDDSGNTATHNVVVTVPHNQ